MNNSPICVDASIVVPLVVENQNSQRVNELWVDWHETGSRLIAPTLLYYEVTNALRRYLVAGQLLEEEVRVALQAALQLEISLYGDDHLHLQALQLATRFSLPATYDAHYLALAERYQADFWTADRRLVNAVQKVLPWVHLVGA